MAAKKNAAKKLSIEGELSIYTAAELNEKITAALLAESALEIDLAQVSEIDSAGLQLLLLAKREGAARNQPVTLINHSQAVVECLDMCNLVAAFGDPIVLPA